MEETENERAEGTDNELVEVQEPVSEREAEVLGEGTGRKGGELRAKPMTPKMLSLMQKVAEFRYLTMEEIELVYANQSYAYSVINSLKDAGLLAEFKTGVQPRKAFYLKPRGYRLLQTYGQLRLKRRFQPQNFLPFIFDHRRACAKAGIILEKHPLISGYVPESILWERKRPHQSKVCDAEFLFKAPDTEKPLRVGLEVELTQKSRENLVQSFRNFQDRTDLDQVWWLCGNQTVFRAVATLGAELRWIPQPQFLATWEHFLEARHRLELADPKGTVYTIDPDKPSLSHRPEPPAPKPVPVAVPVVAQAKAPRPPEPAPISPVDASRSRCTLRILEVARQWVKESWVRKRPDPYSWDMHWRFRRWGLVATLFVATLLGTGGYYVLKYPWLIECARALQVPSWRTRRLSAQTYSGNGWLIEAQSLRSFGGLYRLKVFIVNRTRQVRELKWIRVHDDRKNLLGRLDFTRDSISPDFGVVETLEFQDSIALRKFKLILAHGTRPEISVVELKFK